MSTTSIEHRVATKTPAAVPLRQQLKTGTTAAIAGLIAVEAYAALVKIAGAPIRAGFIAAPHAQPVTAVGFATGVVVSTFWGTVLAIVLCKHSGRPRRGFLLVSTILAALSLVVPPSLQGRPPPRRSSPLPGVPSIVASVVIPILAGRLPTEA
jgi:hypothetical protein